MPYVRKKILVAFALFMLVSMNDSYACNIYRDIPFNQIYRQPAEPIIKCIQEDGGDPFGDWLAWGGNKAKMTSSGIRAVRANTPAHRPTIQHVDIGCDTANTYDDAKAGAKHADAATNSCETGPSDPLSRVRIPEPKVPEVSQDQIDCARNLFGALQGLLSGGSAQTAAKDAGLTASASVRDGCASASLGLCGLGGGIGGTICTNTGEGPTPPATAQGSEPLSKQNVPPDEIRFVELQDIPKFDLAFDPSNGGNIPLTISCPKGCLVEYGVGTDKEIQLPPLPANDYITVDADGFVFTSKFQLKDADGVPVQLPPLADGIVPPGGVADPLTFVSIIGNDGVLGVDEALFIENGNIPDQQTAFVPEADLNTGSFVLSDEQVEGNLTHLDGVDINGLPCGGECQPPTLVGEPERPEIVAAAEEAEQF